MATVTKRADIDPRLAAKRKNKSLTSWSLIDLTGDVLTMRPHLQGRCSQFDGTLKYNDRGGVGSDAKAEHDVFSEWVHFKVPNFTVTRDRARFMSLIHVNTFTPAPSFPVQSLLIYSRYA